MSQNDQAVPPTQTSPTAGQAPIRWAGFALIVFDRRPFAKALIKGYALAVLIGYCALIGLADSLSWPWLTWWLKLWDPVVGILRQVIPLFDNFEHALVAKGFGYRVELIQNLIAFEWIVTPPFSFSCRGLYFGYLAKTGLSSQRSSQNLG